MQSISEMFTPNSNCTRPRVESWSKRVKNFGLSSTFLSKILSFNYSAMRHSKDTQQRHPNSDNTEFLGVFNFLTLLVGIYDVHLCTFKELNEYRYEMKVTMKFANQNRKVKCFFQHCHAYSLLYFRNISLTFA